MPIVKDQLYDQSFALDADTVYLRCVWQGLTVPVNYGPLARGVSLVNCTFRNIHLARDADQRHLFYVNNGHREAPPTELYIDGLTLDDCEAAAAFEFKASAITIRDSTQKSNCKFAQTVRLRHGKDHQVYNCTGFGEIASRGWKKWFVNNPGAKIKLWSGNLPARYDQWSDMHVPGGGQNMQCCEGAYVEQCGSVHVGAASSNVNNTYPALNCVVDPKQTNVKVGFAKNLMREHMTNQEQLGA